MWIEPMVHNAAKFIYALVFCVLMLGYYLKFKKEKQYQKLFESRLTHLWILGILTFRVGLVLYTSVLFFFNQLGKFDVVNYVFVAEFFNIIYLAIQPHLLDMNTLSEKLKGKEKIEPMLSDLELHKLSALAVKVEAYFKSTQVYLNSQLTVELLGTFTGIPHRTLSLAIKHVHGISFRDYLNNYRIAYIEENFSNPKLGGQSTVEKLAKEAGFGSRQGFYSAFKKAKGCTPKEYFSQMKV
jgi:AraC-like DNA-binding protein